MRNEIESYEMTSLSTEAIASWIGRAFGRLNVAPDGRPIGLDPKHPEHEIWMPHGRAVCTVADVMRHWDPVGGRDCFTVLGGGDWWGRQSPMVWGSTFTERLSLRGSSWTIAAPIVRAWLDHVVTPAIASEGHGARRQLIARPWRDVAFVAEVENVPALESRWQVTLIAAVTY